MIVALGLSLKVATIILGCILSMLLSDFNALGPISIPTPPTVALTDFSMLIQWLASIHCQYSDNWYPHCVYLCSCMTIYIHIYIYIYIIGWNNTEVGKWINKHWQRIQLWYFVLYLKKKFIRICKERSIIAEAVVNVGLSTFPLIFIRLSDLPKSDILPFCTHQNI